MSNDLLGMDIGAARDLAARASRWGSGLDGVESDILSAELLSQVLSGAVPLLVQVGDDGRNLGTRINRAADALSSFTISLGSPFVVGEALANVTNFDGGDNDPELDQRLTILRGLVGAHSDSDEQAALVLSTLLANGGPATLRSRETSEIDAARADVNRLAELERTGAISANDPRIDRAVSQLDEALSQRNFGDADPSELLHAFVSDKETPTSTLLASVLVGQPVESIAIAHSNHLPYADVAAGLSELHTIGASAAIRFRDTTGINDARDELAWLAALEQSGAISANDPRIDQAVSRLEAALSTHAVDEEQTRELLSTFVSAPTQIDSATLLASVLLGMPTKIAATAHRTGQPYEAIAGAFTLQEVDHLTTVMRRVPDDIATGLGEERRALLIELAGTDDPAVLRALDSQLGQGASALEAFENLEAQLQSDVQQRADLLEQNAIRSVAQQLDIDFAEAEVLYDDLTASTLALAEQGFALDDAARATEHAHFNGFDIDAIGAHAVATNVTLEEATQDFHRAQVLDLSIDDLVVYDLLVEHFPELDAAIEDRADGIVSVDDLYHIVNNSERYSQELVLAASALLGSPALRHRLDRARDNTDNIVGASSYGATRADDLKYSLSDIDSFEYKQIINSVLAPRLDEIDVATQGGNMALIDSKYREEDFEFVLAHADEFDLTAQERAAVEAVLEADWYDKTWMQRNSDFLILISAITVGGVVFFTTGGTGAGLSASLVSSAWATGAGTGLAAGMTLTENWATGDPLTEDLERNMVTGAIGGLGGASLVGGLAGTPPSATLNAIGLGGDVAGLTSAGLLDPILEQMLDEKGMDDAKGFAQGANYVLGAASLVGGARNLGAKSLAGEATDKLVDNLGVSGVQRGGGVLLDVAAAEVAED